LIKDWPHLTLPFISLPIPLPVGINSRGVEVCIPNTCILPHLLGGYAYSEIPQYLVMTFSLCSLLYG